MIFEAFTYILLNGPKRNLIHFHVRKSKQRMGRLWYTYMFFSLPSVPTSLQFCRQNNKTIQHKLYFNVYTPGTAVGIIKVFLFFSYKILVKRKYETERHIATNNMKMREAKWKPVLKSCNFASR